MKNKNWLLLMLLIFVGQVVAAPSSSCKMDMDSTFDKSSMQYVMNHDMGMMADMQTSGSMDMPCCGDQCDCSDGICFSVSILANPSMDFQLPSIDSYSVAIHSFQLYQISSAIYRPPILS